MPRFLFRALAAAAVVVPGILALSPCSELRVTASELATKHRVPL